MSIKKIQKQIIWLSLKKIIDSASITHDETTRFTKEQFDYLVMLFKYRKQNED